VLAATGLSKDAALLDLLVEPAQGTLEAFVLTHTNFCQSGNHLLWGSVAITVLDRAPESARIDRPRTGLAECSPGPNGGQPGPAT